MWVKLNSAIVSFVTPEMTFSYFKAFDSSSYKLLNMSSADIYFGKSNRYLDVGQTERCFCSLRNPRKCRVRILKLLTVVHISFIISIFAVICGILDRHLDVCQTVYLYLIYPEMSFSYFKPLDSSSYQHHTISNRRHLLWQTWSVFGCGSN